MRHINITITMMLAALYVLPAFAQDFTYDGITYTVLDADAKTCTTKHGSSSNDYTPGNQVSGDLIIPEIVSDGNNDYTVITIGRYGFCNCKELTQIILPPTITTIGEGAFFECHALNNINLPESIESIEAYALENCSSLESIIVPDKVDYIHEFAFYGCKKLKTVVLPDAVTHIERYAFFDCSNLESINIPKSLVTLEKYAFGSCSNLSSLTLPESLTSIGEYAFCGCSNLASINIPASVETMWDGAFIGCTSLTSIILPKSLTYITEEMFRDCSNLSSITLPESLQHICKSAFFGCSSLTSIKLPDSVISLRDRAFEQCSGLTSITLPESLTSIGARAFSGCDQLTSVTYNAPTPITATEDVFANTTYLQATLSLPNAALAYIQATTPWKSFKTILAKDGSVIPAGSDFEYEGISYTVLDAEALTCTTKAGPGTYDGGVMIPGNNLSGDVVIPSTVSFYDKQYEVTAIGKWGFTMTKITSIVLPETLKSIDESAFRLCNELNDINLPNGISNIGERAFEGCSKLVSTVVIPESITNINALAFANCSMTSVKLHSAVETIQASAFSGCMNLKDINFPESLKKIFASAFYNCGFESISLPASLETLGRIAFGDNYGLKYVSLPSSLKVVEDQIFEQCSKIEKVEYNAISPIAANANMFAESVYSNATLSMPNAALADIQATVPWNIFKKITAKDGSIGKEDFEYDGIIYTIIDVDAKTCKTKAGYYVGEQLIVDNKPEGDLVIPSKVPYDNDEYLVTEIGDASFLGAAINSVTLPDTDITIGVKAFRECHNLSSVKLPSSLTKISEGMFYDCGALKTIQLPNSVKSIDFEAFTYSGITSISLPENLNFIGGSAFYGCSNLETISLPKSLATVENIAFFGADALNDVIYDAEIPSTFSEDLFADIVYEKASLTMPNAALADIQATVPWNLFKKIIAKDGAIGNDDFEFDGIIYTVIDAEAKTCRTKAGYTESGLEETDKYVPGNTFEGDLVIPSKVSDGTVDYTVVEIGDYGFSNMDKITSVTLPETITKIGGGAFSGCGGMTSVVIPESVSSILWYAFHGCVGLTSVKLPPSLINIGENTFAECSGLSEITLPSALEGLDVYAFYHCVSLSSITCPESLKTIGNYVFSGCAGLASITLPTSLTSIGMYAFEGCSNLSSIDIPESMTSIGEYAFSDCTGLVSIIYDAVAPITASENVFGHASYEEATLRMPNAALTDIKATIPWKLFGHITAKDGTVVPGPGVGEEIEADGIIYVVTDDEVNTVKTKDGEGIGNGGNSAAGNLVLPEIVQGGEKTYTVTAIGDYGFSGNSLLESVTIPSTVESVGSDALAVCERLTSLVWLRHHPLNDDVVNSIGNPNLLVFVDSAQFAPAGLDHNIVVLDYIDGRGNCENLVLTQGYPFTPLYAFNAEQGRLTKKFTEITPIDGCGGWNTLVLPFNVTEIRTEDGRTLTSFASLTDIKTQTPFWLYEADSEGEWKEAKSIHGCVPYLVSMPNNEEYNEEYRITGNVTFFCSEPGIITPQTSSPMAVTWTSGREFRSLWLPLDEAEAADAMGLNVGIDNLAGDNGELLAPGSAFHVDVTPKPLEAYVTRLGSQKAMKIGGGESSALLMETDDSLYISTSQSSIIVRSGSDRKIDIFTMDGIRIRTLDLKAGETYTIDHLTQGIYIVEGRKLIVN